MSILRRILLYVKAMSIKFTQKLLSERINSGEDDQYLEILKEILLELRNINNKLSDIESAPPKYSRNDELESREQTNSGSFETYKSEPFIPTIESKDGKSKGTSATTSNKKKRDVSKNIKGLKDLNSGENDGS